MLGRAKLAGRWIASAAIPLALLAAGCTNGKRENHQSGGDVDHSWSPQGVTSVKGVPVAAVRAAIQRRLAEKPPEPIEPDVWRHVSTLYGLYAQGPLWFDDEGVYERRASALATALADAAGDGIRLERYPIQRLVQDLDSIRHNDHPTAEQIADADALFTATYAALAEDLMTGQVDPRSVSQAWHINPREDKVDSALVLSLASASLDKAITRMRPQFPDYQFLREQLGKYRELSSKGGWPSVPEGDELKPGASGSTVRLDALRRRLAAEGYSIQAAPARDGGTSASARRPSSGSAAVYDRALAGAVAEFQARHGIPIDSILGTETVKSLNVPVTYRMGQIAANLERFRWLPRTFGDRYILVNVPAFRLDAYENGEETLSMKVIVGADYGKRATPVFSDSMEYVVFRPYWVVPDSIAAREIFPKIEADPGFLERGHYQFFHENGNTRVRQLPGTKNSLGLVKFMFPNDFNIYLHDTPEDQLFEKDVRAFSHGCIRLEKPTELAEWVLGWREDKVSAAMQNGPDNRTVTLPRKIPVYIAYFTTYARDGQLYYGNDLYDRDSSLVNAVASGQSDGDAVRAVMNLKQLIGD